jgi:hypothetical protein
MAAAASERIEHELRLALQKVIESECRHLLTSYGFKLKAISSYYSCVDDSYRFQVKIYSPQLDKVLTVQNAVTRRSIYDMGFKGDYLSTGGAAFAYTFHAMARNINYEIEKVTKDMPLPGHYTSSASASSPFSYYQSGCITMTPSDIQSYSVPSITIDNSQKRRSKFEYIDMLIDLSKTRLTSKYTKPNFDFNYF